MFDKNTASDKSVRFRSRGFKTEYYSYLSSMAFIAIVKELFSYQHLEELLRGVFAIGAFEKME